MNDRNGRPAQYHFEWKVTEPYGAPRDVLETRVTREEFINMIMIVKEQLEEAKNLRVSIEFKIFRILVRAKCVSCPCRG